MKLIRLNGKYSHLTMMVDDEDFDRMNSFAWYGAERIRKVGITHWVERGTRIGGIYSKILAHRFLLNVADTNVHVDHIDGNPLNNQRNNLRLSTPTQNMFNAKKRIGCSSQFKGVTAEYNHWRAYCSIDGKRVWLGRFAHEEDAAKAYDQAAKNHYGEFAKTNF